MPLFTLCFVWLLMVLAVMVALLHPLHYFACLSCFVVLAGFESLALTLGLAQGDRSYRK